MSGNQERAGLRAAHVVRSAWIGGFNMAKLPDSEYIAHLQTLDIEGKIAWMMSRIKALDKDMDDVCKQLNRHLSAHQALMEAREITGAEAGNILKRLRKEEKEAREAGK